MKRIRYWCTDESRFGLLTIPGRVITLKGVKPVGNVQWKRENFYLYGVIEPLTGEHFFLEFSHLDTVCFEIFLQQFACAYPEDLHIFQLDNAAFHNCQYLTVPENIILLFQPPHTPQVNPIERLWEEIKKPLRWESFDSLEQLREVVWKHLDALSHTRVASVSGWDFILEALFVSGIS